MEHRKPPRNLSSETRWIRYLWIEVNVRRYHSHDLSLLSCLVSCWTFSKASLSCVTSSSAAQHFLLISSSFCRHDDICFCKVSHLCWHESHLSCFSSNSPFSLLKKDAEEEGMHKHAHSYCPYCNFLWGNIFNLHVNRACICMLWKATQTRTPAGTQYLCSGRSTGECERQSRSVT